MVLVAVWAVVLATAGGWAMINGAPTAREQTSIGQARPVVDTAVARLASAAGAAGTTTVIAISGFSRVEACRVTYARSGARYERELTVYTPAETEETLLDRVAVALPSDYHSSVRHATVSRFSADAGDYVGISGGVAGPGRVRFIVNTGCRPVGDVVGAAGDAPTAAEQAPAQAVLAALGVTAREWHRYRLTCPQGGSLSTVEAIAAGGLPPGGLEPALSRLAAGTAVVVAADVYAFRADPAGVAVRVVGDHLVVTVATACPD